MTGIGVQQGVLLAFTGLMITFHVRALREGKIHDTRWQPLIYTLYGALILISIRIIFRLVEFSAGEYGPIPTNETYFYALEATPMVICLLTLAVVHPGYFLRGPGSEFAKPIITKGAPRWWCCGRRRRTVVQPGYESTKAERTGRRNGEYRRHSSSRSDVPLTAESDSVYDRHSHMRNDVPLTAQFSYRERV